MKFKMKDITPSNLRAILSVSLFVITGIGIGIFVLANGQLQQYASTVSQVAAQASASENSLATLQKLKTVLGGVQNVITRTNSIVADSQGYQYQDQIITDLNQFAANAGIGIANVSFASAGKTAVASGGVVPSGVKSTSVTVALVNPVNYAHLLGFIQSIEQNLTKMQISRVSISKGTTGNTVSSDVLTIEVYIR